MNSSSTTGRSVTITIDGAPLRVPVTRTVAAALLLDQERMAWRSTRRSGSARGLFCGIGVCYDCLATINGRASQRTCLVEVADGMEVSTGSTTDAPGEPSARPGDAAHG
ncbi:MAG TPA: (2Fe-2S)-binding protein [Candidatus Brachybacterium merdavium]|uniref:(2Fe-2S)-binding protein n=1 Tax=Candidatus Brachybacterium merdavium TaxID=2838513 RepID=A0A9D2RMI7_9MICO|nr:(2Fe-2S)-binding protein [Candidatus Brachybacterium merdavium]